MSPSPTPSASPHKIATMILLFSLLLASTTLTDAFNHAGIISSPITMNALTGRLHGLRVESPLVPAHRCQAQRNNNLELSDVSPRNESKKQKLVGSVALGLFAISSNAAVAFAAKKTATSAAASSVSSLVLPTTSTLVMACLLPTLLGYYKSEYGVSYGYGTAIAVSSSFVLSSVATASGSPLLPLGTTLKPATLLPAIQAILQNVKSLLPISLPAFHASSLLFYGTRLDLFLFYRELCLPRFRAMRERIEERAKKQGSRLKRTPFLVSCAFLYFCMICPLLVTARLCGGLNMTDGLKMGFGGGLVPVLEQSLRVSVLMTLSGFLLGAIGDVNKSIGKAIQGEDSLVTGGIFRFFRHPNYTGEVIGWCSSCCAAFLAVFWKAAKTGEGGLALLRTMAPYLSLSVMGAIGISFVLGTATAGLEYRQHEKYGDMEEYKQWVKKSWVGFKMGQQRKKPSEDTADGDDEGSVDSEEKAEL